MKRYPLVFGPCDLIQGNGFLAGVEMEGRAELPAREWEAAVGDVLL